MRRAASLAFTATLLANGVVTAAASAPAARTAAAQITTAQTAAATLYSPKHAIYKGLGFDTCQVPSTAITRSWLASPYRAVNMYIGGSQRGCPNQPELTAQWVSMAVSNGWNLIPTFVDLQPPCTTSSKDTFTASTARAAGRDAANRAVTAMQAIGLGAGNIVYDDFEIFNDTKANCAAAAVDFVEAWTNRLHALDYRAGMYAVADAKGVERGLDAIATDASPRPDAIWFNNWYTGTTLSDPDLHGHWKGHRIHQYRGDHTETFNGNPLSIDNDILNGDVVGAVVPARATAPFEYLAAPPLVNSPGLRERTSPTTTQANTTGVVYPYGTTIEIACQAVGETIDGSYVWDRLTNGNYVSDINTTTTGGLGFTAGIPRCDRADPVATMLPGAQMTLRGKHVFAWSGQDFTTGDAPKSGIASYDVRWQRAKFSGGFGKWSVLRTAPGKSLSLSLDLGYTYCAQVRAIDRSGNVGAWSASSCVARALDDVALRIARGSWKRLTGSSFFQHTATATGAAGARLIRRDAAVRTVALVATTCPRCGTVRVAVHTASGNVSLGTVDLTSAKRRYHQLLVLDAIPLAKGTVRLTTVGGGSGSGGKVQIDGLLLSRVNLTLH